MRRPIAAAWGAVKTAAGVMVMRKTVSTLVQISGVAALSAGGFAYDATWGFLILGGCLVLLGVALEIR